jgi:preprotein translocase subunit SecA
MRQGIGLQAYGQQDPLVAYKREARDMWDQLLSNIRRTISHGIYHVSIQQSNVPNRAPVPAGATAAAATAVPAGRGLRENRPDQAAVPGPRQNGKKIGRNDPCFCGSGKKYKRCHGLAA